MERGERKEWLVQSARLWVSRDDWHGSVGEGQRCGLLKAHRGSGRNGAGRWSKRGTERDKRRREMD